MSKLKYYQCPSCHATNDETRRACDVCNGWLGEATLVPAPKSSFWRGAIFYIVVFALTIGIVHFVSNRGAEAPPASVHVPTNGGLAGTPSIPRPNPATKVQSPEPKVVSGTRSNPIPVGQTERMDVEQFVALTGANRRGFSFELTVNRHLRGDEALAIINGWNMLNQPREGYEYLMAEMTIKVLRSEKGDALSINPTTFSLVSGSGVKYNPVMVAGEDTVYKELYEGAILTSWAVFEAKPDDAAPLIEHVGTWFEVIKKN